MKGYVQVYTGNGKGKTTAALGLALRAVGAGLNVYIGQFIKGRSYNEIRAIAAHLKNITIKQYGRKCFIVDRPTAEDIQLAQKGLAEMDRIIQSGAYDLVIMDEANIAVSFNLFSVAELLDVIKRRPEHVEIVVTGRNAHPDLIGAADLVTEMQDLKHYFQKSVAAREGIEY
jgi:cob(I)alamin adenosyltransferase